MIALAAIDHVCLRVADVAEATARWSVQFGLTVREQSDQRSLLACDYEPYSLELRLAAPGDELGHAHTGWELRDGCTLDDARAHLAARGVGFEEHDGALCCADPEGINHHLLPTRERTPADAWPAISRSSSTLRGFHPRRLGHMNCLCVDVERSSRFYSDVLGMQLTDRLGSDGHWLRIGNEHHVMALVQMGYSHLHHLAFEWIDMGELRVLFDHLGQHGRWLGWGPVRHGIGQNICGYVRITEEPLFVENYCDMEQIGSGHVPRDWPDNRFSSNTWGPLPPRSYFRFDEAAVESERESLEMKGIPLAPIERNA